MTLSIHDAASEHPQRIAMVVGGRELTFAELSGLVEKELLRRPHAAFITRHDVPSVVALLAHIEAGVPVVPLHSRLPAPQRAELCRRASRWNLDDDILAVLFTSGSIGVPKGVMLGRSAFVASAAASAARLGWRDDDRWLCPLPLSHVGGLSIVVRCLLARSCSVLPELGRGLDTRRLTRSIERDRVTMVSLVPTMLERLLDDTTWKPPSHLRAVLVGGARLPERLLARAVDRGVPVISTYGMTEACSQIHTGGEPIDGAELEIRDGKLFVRGPMLMRGYAPPHDTEQVFDADGWFCTGDRAALDNDGTLRVLGRAGDTILTGGENVDPTEVERVLEGVEGIKSACVFGVADETWGQLVAAAIVGSPSTVELAAKRTRTLLAPHMQPRLWCCVDKVPLGSTGKPDRSAARDQFSDHLRQP
jgi:O-succinylbenzoic acid--CoA ligase